MMAGPTGRPSRRAISRCRSIVSRTASSSGVLTRHTSVVAGSARVAPMTRSVSPTDRAGERAERARGGEQRQRMARRRRVDDDEIVHLAPEAGARRATPAASAGRGTPAALRAAASTWKLVLLSRRRLSMRMRSTPCTKSPSASRARRWPSPGRRHGRGSRPPRAAPSSAPSRPRPTSTASTRRFAATAARASAAATAFADPALAGHHDQPLRGEGQASGARRLIAGVIGSQFRRVGDDSLAAPGVERYPCPAAARRRRIHTG